MSFEEASPTKGTMRYHPTIPPVWLWLVFPVLNPNINRFQEFLRKGQWPTTGYDVPEVHFVGDSCGQMEDCLCHDWDRQEMICGYVETYAAKDDG